MKKLFVPIGLCIACCLLSIPKVYAQTTAANELSEKFVTAAMNDDADLQNYVNELATYSKENLENQIQTNDQKKAFWLNLYNGYVLYLLKDNPELYEARSSFFSNEQFTVAGERMSLDDVEHGMIRNSRIKISKGLLKKFFPSSFERTFRVTEVDWRIHFALNCGAKSCPPVDVYEVATLEEKLKASSIDYLNENVEYDDQNNSVSVPVLMSWFSADFCGKKGVRNILKKIDLIPQDTKPEIKYLDYDWTLDLDNYK